MKKCNRLTSHLAFPIDYSIISINRPTTTTGLSATCVCSQNECLNLGHGFNLGYKLPPSFIDLS